MKLYQYEILMITYEVWHLPCILINLLLLVLHYLTLFFQSGHQPKVRVWEVEDKVQVAEFGGHKFGISCVVSS